LNRTFTERAWDDFNFWAVENKKIIKKINQLLDDIERNGHQGIGQTEPLTGDLTGWWSKRIDGKNRLVYKIESDCIVVYQCKEHYGDK